VSYLDSPFRHDLLSFMMSRGKNRSKGAHSAITAEKEIHRGRFMDRFYMSTLPFIKINRKIVARLISHVQGVRVYRKLAKRLVKEAILYKWESWQDSGRRIFAMNKKGSIGRVTIGNSSEINSLYQGWWISDMWVDWRYRGLGVGSRLTEMVCDFAAGAGASEVSLLVFKDNKAAIRLYHKLGFSFASVPRIDKQLRKEARKFGRQQLIMKKELSLVR